MKNYFFFLIVGYLSDFSSNGFSQRTRSFEHNWEWLKFHIEISDGKHVLQFDTCADLFALSCGMNAGPSSRKTLERATDAICARSFSYGQTMTREKKRNVAEGPNRRGVSIDNLTTTALREATGRDSGRTFCATMPLNTIRAADKYWRRKNFSSNCYYNIFTNEIFHHLVS